MFNSFMSIIQSRIAGVTIKDYSNFKYKRITMAIPNSFIPTNKNDIKLIDKVSNIINKYNNGIFNMLVDEINNIQDNRVFIFVRVANLHEMNKLKRVFKRPNYKTLRIFDNAIKASKAQQLKYKLYKFDSKIEYVNTNHLLMQAKLFIQKHVPTIKTIKN